MARNKDLADAPVVLDTTAVTESVRVAVAGVVALIADAVDVKIRAGHTGSARSLLDSAENVNAYLANITTELETAVRTAGRDEETDRNRY
jgi:hypothetical protein